jgi:putative ABC transport system permease protein
MRIPFALRLAWREGRSSARRLGVYMGAITLGVSALVAINSFRKAIRDSVFDESRSLLGADFRVSSNRPYPDSVSTVLDSLVAAGIETSKVTGTVSVALSAGGATRLVQVRGVSGGYPFYGDIVTQPAGLWPFLTTSTGALVEPAVLVALGVETGDSVKIGERWFRIDGTLEKPPIEIGFQSALAPRVYVSARSLDEAGLIRFGSLATYQTYVRMPEDEPRDAFINDHADSFRLNSTRITTANREASSVSRGFDTMTRFLGLIGLTALLLGGLGVASAVSVFVREKRAQVAVLRCVGATRRTAFLAYLIQAMALGFVGAAIGCVLGLVAQAGLPLLIGNALPFTIGFRFYPRAVGAGLVMGVWVATVFALLPLLSLRNVPPLQALRQDFEPVRTRLDAATILTWLALMVSVVALSVLQAPNRRTGLAFAGGLLAVVVLLRGVAWLLMQAARRFFPRRAAFATRQGVSSLFRPSNQTAAVTVALGFGVFLIATIWIVERNLIDRFSIEADDAAPNVAAFDIQSDQRADVVRVFDAAGVAANVIPLVPARIAAINDRRTTDMLADSNRDVPGWALRRDYRNTYRAAMTPAETLVAGEWWDGAAVDSAALPRISIEQDLARNLGVGVGDRITWDFQGIEIETRIASIRTVDWARLETNFFVVFEPGSIESAPQTLVALARVPGAETRGRIQRDLVRLHPNISTLDLTLVQETISSVVSRLTLAIRFMAIFSVAGGAIVLAGAIAAGRSQRLREAVLLRTLGATRRTVRRVLFTEYAALGLLAGLAGVALSSIGGWALVHFVFDMPFRLPITPLIAVWLGIAALAMAIGAAGNRLTLSAPPLAALREAG